MFGVYGDLIYHNSCGSRAKVGRPYPTPGAPADTSRMCYEGGDIHRRTSLPEEYVVKMTTRIHLTVFDAVFKELEDDMSCNFVSNFFLGETFPAADRA